MITLRLDKKAEEKARIGYVDCVKGIGILPVILGHVGVRLTEVLKYIDSLHMPLFLLWRV